MSNNPNAAVHQHAAELLTDQYGLAGHLSRLPGENDNFELRHQSGKRFILKLADNAQNSDLMRLEQIAVQKASEANLGIALPTIIPTRDQQPEARLVTQDGTTVRGVGLFPVRSGPPDTDFRRSPITGDRSRPG